jgi:hypothetical protein
LDLAGEPRTLALALDEVRGRARGAFVATTDGDLQLVSLENPALPRLLASKRALHDPRRMLVAGRHLYVADGTAGVQVFDIEKPAAPKAIAALPTVEARGLALTWPWLLVADGPGGLLIVDVATPAQPKVLADVDLNFESAQPNDAFDVAVLFQASRTRSNGAAIERTRPRHLAFVASGLDGLRVVDFTAADQPVVLHETRNPGPLLWERGDVRGVAVNTVFDLGTAGGGLKSQERDYVYVLVHDGPDEDRREHVRVVDVTDPLRPRTPRNAAQRLYTTAGRLAMVRMYNAPFLQHFVLAAGAGGVGTLLDVTRASAVGIEVAASIGGASGMRDLVVEELALDRLCDEEGQWIKDVSHADCRYLTPAELAPVLRAQLPAPPPEPRRVRMPGDRR